jgi:hypothetical protein
MDNKIMEVFNIISNLKNFDFTADIAEDIYYIKAYYPKLKGIIKYKKWEEIVIDYSIETGEDIFDSCEILQPIIYEKYSK